MTEQNVDEENYTSSQRKVVINYLRLKGDRALPCKKEQINKRYDEIKGRKRLTLHQHLEDLGFYDTKGDYSELVERVMLERDAEEEAEAPTMIDSVITFHKSKVMDLEEYVPY